jgi:hypothetical protein
MKNQNVIIPVVVAIVVGVAAFFGGTFYQKGQDSLSGVTGAQLQTKLKSLGLTRGLGGAGALADAAGFFGRGGTRPAGGLNTGTVVSLDAKSITIKLLNGSTKVVYFTSATKVDKSVVGSSSDLKVGQNIITTGASNSDGSVSATTIQIRPEDSTPPVTQ